MTKQRIVYAGLGLWVCSLLTMFALVWRYKLAPGDAPEAPEVWPSESKLARSPDRANVVMIAHPQCTCTRASMKELARLADELHGAAKIHVVLVRPEGTDAGYEDGVVADLAAAIPAVDLVVDIDGIEAKRFGAVVSGSTMVYGRDSKLLFRGGLTTARGHEGRGPAHDRIIELVALGGGRAAERVDAPTFGCALSEPQTTARIP
jgi:hypothetical protein